MSCWRMELWRAAIGLASGWNVAAPVDDGAARRRSEVWRWNVARGRTGGRAVGQSSGRGHGRERGYRLLLLRQLLAGRERRDGRCGRGEDESAGVGRDDSGRAGAGDDGWPRAMAAAAGARANDPKRAQASHDSGARQAGRGARERAAGGGRTGDGGRRRQ